MSPIITRILSTLQSHKEIILLFLLTCLFFYPVIIHYDQMLYPPGDVVGNDITAQYSFWRSVFATSILQGDGIPFWNPYVFSGTPFLGNPLSSLFYPFTGLFVFFNPALLFGWLFLADVLLIGLFTFIFARTINLSKSASLFSAVAFMFSGTIILRVYAGHLSNLDAIVWFPLALIFCERSFSGNRYTSGIGAGISLALMFLSGNIQFALYGACIVLLYITGRVLQENKLPSLKEKFSHWAFIILISLGICCALSAVQILPTWEYSQLSNRAGGVSYEFSSAISLPPSYLITALVPDVFGNPLDSGISSSAIIYWELCFYMGILPLMLAVLGIIFDWKPHTVLFLIIALFALLFSLGHYFPLYSLIYNSIPGFSLLRIPSSLLFACTFSIAILAGTGWDALYCDTNSLKKKFNRFLIRPLVRPVTLALAGCMGIVLATGLLLINGMSGCIIPVLCGYTLGIVLFCILPVVQEHPERCPAYSIDLLKIILIILLIADLFIFGMRFIDTRSPSEVFKNPDYLPVIINETDTYYRVYDETDFLNQNQYIAYKNHLSLISGYDPTYLKDYQVYFTRSQQVNYTGYYWWMQGAVIKDFDILRSLNVRYIVTNRNYAGDFAASGLECVYTNNSVRVYRLNVTSPRAYVIPLSEFNNKTPVSLQPAEIEQYSPNTIRVNVTTEEPGYLVLSEIYYPGWTVQDNGKTSAIERYQGIFRAVYLDPGTHRVAFTYFPKSLTL